MKRSGLLFLVIVLSVSLMPWAVPAAGAEDGNAGSMTFTLYAGEYTITKDEAGLDVIQMEGFSSTLSPGDPVLPHKVYNIAVPPDIDWASLKLNIVSAETRVLEETYDIGPAGPLAPGVDGQIQHWGEGKDIVDGKNMKVYGTDADFPDTYLKLLPYSQMRKWKFTKVDFTPFQYNPVSQQLTLIQNVTIEISYDRSAMELQAGLMNDTVMDDVAAQILLNYDAAKSWYEAGLEIKSQLSPSPAPYDYVIITTSAIETNSTKLADFVAHKQSHGHTVLVVTEGTWGAVTGDPPNHKAEKIRKWLQNNYVGYSTDYVLLIGDPEPYEGTEGDVPMKMCHPEVNHSYNSYFVPTPTDYIYADLTGNWDVDNDGVWGEWSDDYGPGGGVDFTPDVYVGRIPVYDAAYTTLDSILQKIIDYETEGSIGWRESALLPMSFSDDHPIWGPTDGSYLGHQMQVDYLNGAGYSSWTMYQQGSACPAANSVYPSDEELRGGTVVRDRWAANDYGVVCWWAHGSATSTGVGYSGCWDGTLFDNTQTSPLNDSYPAFTYQCSCENGWPENNNNLQYAILKRGGIGTVSATRVSWYGIGQTNFVNSPSNSGIGYDYVSRLVSGTAAGQALYTTKSTIDPGTTYPQLYMNWLDFNLYGDPTTSLTSHEPPPATVTNFRAADGEDGQSALTWTNPSDADLAQVLVKRKTGSYPADHTDGTTVYDNGSPTPGGSVNTADSSLTNGTCYYYAVFGRNSYHWNDGVQAGSNADTGTPGTPPLSRVIWKDSAQLVKLDSGRTTAMGGYVDIDLGPGGENAVSADARFAIMEAQIYISALGSSSECSLWARKNGTTTNVCPCIKVFSWNKQGDFVLGVLGVVGLDSGQVMEYKVFVPPGVGWRVDTYIYVLGYIE